MSQDLLVATHERPVAPEGERTFTISGPVGVELDDLPEALAGAVLAPRFLVEISVPAGARRSDRARATRLARQLAALHRGAVYDPQADRVVFPKRRARSYVAPSVEERIREVVASWYVPGNADDSGVGRALLAELRAACPEAMPRRYDESEPFQRRFDDGGEPAFLACWHRVGGTGPTFAGHSLWWSGQAPCFGGHVSFPPSAGRELPGHKRCTEIELSFDGRALDADPRWREVVAALVPALARRFGACYAAAHVRRGVIAKRGRTWYGPDAERVVMPSPSFQGLPPQPTWLAWFGPAYAPHVAGAFAGRAEPAADGGLWFRGGDLPLDADQLAGVFPALPAALCCHAETVEEYVQRRGEPPWPGEELGFVVAAERIPLP